MSNYVIDTLAIVLQIQWKQLLQIQSIKKSSILIECIQLMDIKSRRKRSWQLVEEFLYKIIYQENALSSTLKKTESNAWKQLQQNKNNKITFR